MQINDKSMTINENQSKCPQVWGVSVINENSMRVIEQPTAVSEPPVEINENR